MMIVRRAMDTDAPAMCEIYNHFVANTHISFEEEPLGNDEMETRIAMVTASLPWYVCETDGRLAGYAYASPWKSRSAYRRSVESTVYVAPNAAGHGVGSTLYGALISDLRQLDVHTVIGGIALPNADSVALHEKMGFRKVAEFAEVGWKFERYIAVGYWQLLL